MKLKQIEINQVGNLYFACYVERREAETEYQGEDDYGLVRTNYVEPHVNKDYVISEARKAAQANNVPFINLVDLSAGVPLVESFAKMRSV